MSTLNQSKKKKFTTGWLIVVACMLMQAIPFGVAANIQPQFMAYILDPQSGYGFTQAGFSLIFTLGIMAILYCCRYSSSWCICYIFNRYSFINKRMV